MISCQEKRTHFYPANEYSDASDKQRKEATGAGLKSETGKIFPNLSAETAKKPKHDGWQLVEWVSKYLITPNPEENKAETAIPASTSERILSWPILGRQDNGDGQGDQTE